MVTMVSSQSHHNFAPSRAPARGRAGVRARVWLGTYHVDHVSALQPCVSKDFAKCMVKNATKCTMLRLPADRKGRPQLRARNLFSGRDQRWRRLPCILREELKTVLSCHADRSGLLLWLPQPAPGSCRPAALGRLGCRSYLVASDTTAPHGRMIFPIIINRGRGAAP